LSSVASMIEILPGLPDDVVGAEGVGEVEARDYETVLIPAVESALADNDRIRLLYVLGDRFDGISGGAAWEDAKLGIEHLHAWERMAVVTDVEWIGHALRAVGWMIPAEIRVFRTSQRQAAEDWITGSD